MKTLLSLFATLLLSSAFADPAPRNINGLSDRLENIACPLGGHMTSKSNATTIYQRAETECTGLPESEMVTCFKKVVQKSTKYAPVVFNGDAIVNQKEFIMTIIMPSSGKKIFNSLREGFHGDGVDGFNLMFNRAGVSGDEYLIETGMVSTDGTSTPMVIVPVKIRLLPDQIYFFFDCNLRWEAKL